MAIRRDRPAVRVSPLRMSRWTRFDQVTLSIGMRNIFDTFPEEASIDNSFGIFPWPAASPFGYNGRFLYTRAEIPLGL